MIQPMAFVTGAGGFIGRRLVARLLEENWSVCALMLPDEALPSIWSDEVTVIRGDVTQPRAFSDPVPEGACWFHLAAMVGDWGAPDAHRKVTVEGTAAMLALAREKAAARFLLASSIVVYGDHIGKGKLDETCPHGRTLTDYDRSKQTQEKLALEAQAAGLPVTIIRPGNVYGPDSGPWVNTMLEELRRHSPALIGGGDFDAGLAYVDNVVKLMVLAARHPEAVGQTYNACDDFGITWRQYLQDLARLGDAPAPRAIPRWLLAPLAGLMETTWRRLGIRRRPPLTRLALRLVGQPNRFSMDKAHQQLGYEPDIDYATAMAHIGGALRSGQ